MIEFMEFPKIVRLNREIVVTEKIDGTNAQVFIRSASQDDFEFGTDTQIELPDGTPGYIRAGSRTRWITTVDDNFGFAQWVYQNAHDLAKLGTGRHFGEWWGMGIQRKYGLKERRFSLFNTVRWVMHDEEPQPIPSPDPTVKKMQERLPACCHLVPILYRGMFSQEMIERALSDLSDCGSAASPGFMKPEGIVVYHTAGNVAFKRTLGGDGAKGARIKDQPTTGTIISDTSQCGCSGCRHRKMDGCTQGLSHYPNGGPDVCFDTSKRKGFSLYINRHHDFADDMIDCYLKP